MAKKKLTKSFDELDDELTTWEFGQIQKEVIGDSRVRQLFGEDRIEPRPRYRGKQLFIKKIARILPPGQKAKE